MRHWATSLLLTLVVAFPALAEEGKADQSTDKQATEAKLQAKATESPIQQLAELRIDEFVVPARVVNLPLPGRTRTLQDVLDRMKEWSKEDKIGAILLDVGDVYLSLPDIEELRGGVAGLKKADKKVMAFFNSGSPEAYLLACAADEIAVPPSGALAIPGIGRLFPFMKGYYQMLGLEYEVITSGRYKYPGFVNRREPDKYFSEEFGAILDSWFADYKSIIAEGRGLSPDDVSKVVDIAVFSATQAQQRGLVDTLAYYDEYRDRLLKRDKMKRYKSEERGLADVNSIQDFVELINRELKRAEESRKAVGPKIAVLHARGPIIDYSLGAGFASQIICRDDFIKVVDELRKNKSIKAVVMRVDSPGGSGYASDVIWKQLRRLDEAKPLVVSMGSVAGSGGYYISCPGRRIFAQPTTITGSIGVLGVFQSAWSQFNRRDYELAEMKRGARSTLGYPHRTLSKQDHAFIQGFIDDFYGIFIERVASTRKIPAEQVRKIAEGRIYTGRQALELELVDELGGLEEAIQSARELAEIPPSAELKIVHYPRGASLGELFESFSSMSVEQALHTFAEAAAPVRPVTFEQQLRIFSRRPQALCWMAVPEFYRPEPPFAFDAYGMKNMNPSADPLERMFQRGP